MAFWLLLKLQGDAEQLRREGDFICCPEAGHPHVPLIEEGQCKAIPLPRVLMYGHCSVWLKVDSGHNYFLFSVGEHLWHHPPSPGSILQVLVLPPAYEIIAQPPPQISLWLLLTDRKHQVRAGSGGKTEYSTAESGWGCQIQVSAVLSTWVCARLRSSMELWIRFLNTAREHRFVFLRTGRPAAHAALQTQAYIAAPICLTVSCTCFFMACAKTKLEYREQCSSEKQSLMAASLRQPLTVTPTLATL